jgi:hypothetical protein
MDGPVDMLLIFFESELMRVPIDRRGLSFAADKGVKYALAAKAN